MSIHPEIKRAIEIIDQRIESLQQIRENLAREFGMDSIIKPATPPPTDADAQLSLVSNGETKTSKEKIAAYLTKHGPSSRSAIFVGTGIPEGTVSYALADKTRFQKTERGWINVPQDHLVQQRPVRSVSGDNKTDIARQFFREQGVHGGTTRELKLYLESKGIGDNEKFAYSAVARLKDQLEIEYRGDRYYATEKLLQSPTQAFIQ